MLRTRVVGLVLITGLAIAGAARDRTSVNAQSGEKVTFAVPRSFVYTITNPDGPNAIAAYEANPETGELIFIGTFPTGGRGAGRLVDSQSPIVANGEWTRLYAVNPGSNDISVLAINADGSLEMIGSPVLSNGIEPASLAFNGDLLYVANKGDAATPPNYTGFRLTEGDQLTRIRKSTRELNIGDNPGQVLLNRSGDVLIGTRINGRIIDSYTVRRNARKYGRLRDVAQLTGQPGPFGAAFNPAADDQLFVSSVRLPGAASYRVFADGAIVPINAVGNAPERAACWATVHPNGTSAWVSNTGTNSLSLYTIGAGGTLSLAGTHSTAAYGRTPFEIALDPGGRFLYELNVGSSQSIHALRVTGGTEDAGLANIGAISLPVPAGSSPIGLVVITR